MNNTKIVSPEKTGKPHFALADTIEQPKSRAIDNLHIEQEGRHLGRYGHRAFLNWRITCIFSVYVPKKGQSKVQGVNQLQSSIGGIIKPEVSYGGASDTQSLCSNGSKKPRFDRRDR